MQRFGGFWTEIKLDRLRQYLQAYLEALKFQPFEKHYIDAFAGTGYVEVRQDASVDAGESESLDEAEQTANRLLAGSARIALGLSPSFDRYTFIEKCPKRAGELERLRLENPDKPIEIRNGDANRVLQELCTPRWFGKRAVLFLDPFGMEVEWKTVEAVARTEAIDLWYLYPIAAVNRLLTRDRDRMPSGWRTRLDLIHGNSDWEQLYRTKRHVNLFEVYETTDKVGCMEDIAAYFVERLKTVFPHVAPNPLFLCNSTTAPIFLLCFAAGNPKGGRIAVKIASHILGSG